MARPSTSKLRSTLIAWGFLARALPYIITPERRALLNTIRFAEGTWKNGLDIGCRVMFGGGLMGSMDRHPDEHNC